MGYKKEKASNEDNTRRNGSSFMVSKSCILNKFILKGFLQSTLQFPMFCFLAVQDVDLGNPTQSRSVKKKL